MADFELALSRSATASRDGFTAGAGAGASAGDGAGAGAGWGSSLFLSRGASASRDEFEVVGEWEGEGEGELMTGTGTGTSRIGSSSGSSRSRTVSLGAPGSTTGHLLLSGVSHDRQDNNAAVLGTLPTARSNRPRTGRSGTSSAAANAALRYPPRPSQRLLHTYPALHATSKRIAPYTREHTYIQHHREQEEHRLRVERELRHTPAPYGDSDAILRLYLQKRRSAIILGPHYRYHKGGGYGKPKPLPVFQPTRQQRGVKDTNHNGSGHHHLQMRRPRDIDIMIKAAKSIGKAYRASVSRVEFRKFMDNKQSLYAWKVTRWARVCLLRRRILRLRNLITMTLTGTIRDHTGKRIELPLWDRVVCRRKAARSIQGVYRVHISVLWLRNFKKARAAGVAQLQRFFHRRIVADRLRRGHLNRLRSVLETRNAGEQQYDQTIIFMHIDKLWWGAQKTKSLSVPYDLQKYVSRSFSTTYLSPLYSL